MQTKYRLKKEIKKLIINHQCTTLIWYINIYIYIDYWRTFIRSRALYLNWRLLTFPTKDIPPLSQPWNYILKRGGCHIVIFCCTVNLWTMGSTNFTPFQMTSYDWKSDSSGASMYPPITSCHLSKLWNSCMV